MERSGVGKCPAITVALPTNRGRVVVNSAISPLGSPGHGSALLAPVSVPSAPISNRLRLLAWRRCGGSEWRGDVDSPSGPFHSGVLLP